MPGILLSLAVVIPLVGGVVLVVRGMLRSHELTEQELYRLEREQAPVEVMQLPTLTTEMTGKVARDPKFEIEANMVRMRGQGY